MIVKVCGIRNTENISRLSRLKIDWMGFIFYEKSPRYVGEDATEGATRSHPFSVASGAAYRQKKVGVFVNATCRQLAETAAAYRLDYLQLHGDESPELCRALRAQGFSIIKAFSIGAVTDLKETTEYENCADFFLFDTKCTNYGGSGMRFDWSILSSYRGKTPFLLSGGIHPGSVEAIKNFEHPQFAGIDLNSGFEIKPGLKDVEKLEVFLGKL